ncbi:MAG: glucosamine-6-phosphate deaminase [Melioribacteraceae bacterium]
MEFETAKMFTVDKLNVVVSENREQVGEVSAKYAASLIKDLLNEKSEIRIVFAAAPSQNEFLHELSKDKTIEWSKIVAFHMDEYIGLPAESPELFSFYLNNHIFSKVNLKQVHLINPASLSPETECQRYEALLKEKPIDIVFMGIGENGHIAFNDPPVADFYDTKFVKIVELEEKCKLQQVNDAGFKTIDEVPPTAFTLTVPALISAEYLVVVVPGIRKAEAVFKTLNDSVSTACPATILRTHSNAALYLDKDSSSLLK